MKFAIYKEIFPYPKEVTSALGGDYYKLFVGFSEGL